MEGSVKLIILLISFVLALFFSYVFLKPEKFYRYTRLYDENDKPGISDKQNSVRAIKGLSSVIAVISAIYFVLAIIALATQS